MVFAWFSHGFRMVFAWFSHGFAWFFHGLRKISLGFRMVFAWFSLVSHGFPMVYARFRTVFAWFSHGFRMVYARFRLVFAWFSHGLRKIFAWFSHGFFNLRNLGNFNLGSSRFDPCNDTEAAASLSPQPRILDRLDRESFSLSFGYLMYEYSCIICLLHDVT